MGDASRGRYAGSAHEGGADSGRHDVDDLHDPWLARDSRGLQCRAKLLVEEVFFGFLRLPHLEDHDAVITYPGSVIEQYRGRLVAGRHVFEDLAVLRLTDTFSVEEEADGHSRLLLGWSLISALDEVAQSSHRSSEASAALSSGSGPLAARSGCWCC